MVIAESSYDESIDVFDLVDESERKLLAINESVSVSKTVTFGQSLMESVNRITAISESDEIITGIPSGLSDGSKSDVTLVSTSSTEGAGSKLAGNSLDELGDGGIEAVIAQNNAKHQDMTHYTVSTVKLDVEKSILSIKDPYGTELSMPGSEVTYKIRLVASGAGTANNLVIDDVVPESMTYKINSMTSDGNAMSDRQDNDIAHFDSGQKIAYFSPGVITSPATHEYTLTYIID